MKKSGKKPPEPPPVRTRVPIMVLWATPEKKARPKTGRRKAR